MVGRAKCPMETVGSWISGKSSQGGARKTALFQTKPGVVTCSRGNLPLAPGQATLPTKFQANDDIK